jgi:hypothetical protein
MDAHGDEPNNHAMSDTAVPEDKTAADEDQLAGFLDRTAIKLMYKPVAVIASVVGGMLASRAFAQIWRALAGKRDIPDPTDEDQSWAAILPAAALHGVVFGVVKALIDRLGAKQFERMTGAWPWQRKRSQAAADDQP